MGHGRDEWVFEWSEEYLEDKRGSAKDEFIVSVCSEKNVERNERNDDESEFFPGGLTYKFANVRVWRIELIVTMAQNDE